MSQIDPVVLLLGLAIGLLGALFHYVKKWARREIEDNIYDYMIVNHPRATVFMLITLFGAIFTMVVAAGVNPYDAQGLIALFTAGYSVDSSVNKS